MQRAAERIERVRGDDGSGRALRQALLEEISRTVSFDAYAWLLTDPETEVGCDPVADVPCMSELPKLIRLKYATETNRWTSMTGPAARLLDATGGKPTRSLVWRELLAAYDVVDVASLVFRDRFGCWGFLDLWRVGPAEPFTDREAEYLTAVVAPVTEALRRVQAETFHITEAPKVPDGPAVLVLAPDLRVRAQTPETEAYLHALVPPAGDRQPIPAGAYNVGAQLRATEDGVDGYHFQVQGHPTVKAIQATFLTIKVTDPNGHKAVFGTWRGALAHAIFIHQGSLDYFHTHVCSPGAIYCTSALGAARVTGSSSAPGILHVGALLPEPGTWRLFLLTYINGRHIIPTFTLNAGS